jgi:Flp pilus assembly protein protease CpaA
MTTGKLAVLAGRHPLIVGMLGSLMSLGVLAISLITLLASREAAVEHAHETSRNVQKRPETSLPYWSAIGFSRS